MRTFPNVHLTKNGEKLNFEIIDETTPNKVSPLNEYPTSSPPD